MLGDGGWMQATNLVLSGLMTLAAALGFSRALGGTKAATAAGALLGVAGIGLVGSGIFPPDPVGGFPPGAPQVATISGILHLAFGLVQFLALAVAAFVMAGWLTGRGDRGTARFSRVSGTVVIARFAGGAALSTLPIGVGLLWLAVVAGGPGCWSPPCRPTARSRIRTWTGGPPRMSDRGGKEGPREGMTA